MQNIPCCIHQPEHLPYPGFWRKLLMSRVWIALDDAQYQKNHFHNRNRIAAPNTQGWAWLTVPVHVASYTSPICDAYITAGFSVRKYMASLRHVYGSSAAAPHLLPAIEDVLCKAEKHLKLWLLNLDLASVIAEWLGIKIAVLLASEMGVPASSCRNATERLVALCRHAGATSYISGSGAAAYMDMAQFEANNLPVVMTPPQIGSKPYPRSTGGFVPNLSMIDLVMNMPDAALVRSFLLSDNTMAQNIQEHVR